MRFRAILPRGRGQLVLLGQKLSLDREDPIEVDEPFLVLLQHQFHRPVRGVRALGEAAGLQLRLQETDQGVFHFLARASRAFC